MLLTRSAPQLPRRPVVSLAAAALLALAAACGGGGGGTTEPATGAISGRVTTGTEAVVGASVVLSGTASRTATTDGSGAFQFTALPPGAYTVAVGLPGSFTLAAGQSITRNATVVAGRTATVDWTAQRASTGGGGDGDGGGQQGNVVEVHLSGTSFSPSVIDVTPGTKVRWIVDGGAHTVTADSRTQPGSWGDSGTLGSGQVFEHTFTSTSAGQTYGYTCVLHASLGMVGTVRVQ